MELQQNYLHLAVHADPLYGSPRCGIYEAVPVPESDPSYNRVKLPYMIP